MIILHKIKIQLFRCVSLTPYILLLYTFSIKAQFYNLPNDYFFNTLTQKQLARVDSEQTHSSIQPYIPFFNKKYEFVADTSYKIFKYISDDIAVQKFFFDHLIHIKSKTGKYEFKVDPLLNVELGFAYYDTTQYQRISTNTRGYIASGTIGKDFYFETMFSENQSQFPYYISNFNKQISRKREYSTLLSARYVP